MKRYNPTEIEKKWQDKWEADGTYITITGTLIGSVLGILGGPLGMLFGAGVGAWVGSTGSTDQALAQATL